MSFIYDAHNLKIAAATVAVTTAIDSLFLLFSKKIERVRERGRSERENSFFHSPLWFVFSPSFAFIIAIFPHFVSASSFYVPPKSLKRNWKFYSFLRIVVAALHKQQQITLYEASPHIHSVYTIKVFGSVKFIFNRLFVLCFFFSRLFAHPLFLFLSWFFSLLVFSLFQTHSLWFILCYIFFVLNICLYGRLLFWGKWIPTLYNNNNKMRTRKTTILLFHFI